MTDAAKPNRTPLLLIAASAGLGSLILAALFQDRVPARFVPIAQVLAGVALLAAFVQAVFEYRLRTLDRRRRDAEAARDSLLARVQQQAANLELQVAERTRSLQDMTQRLQLALHAGAYGVWDWDVVADRHVWDPRQRAIYGLPEEPADQSIAGWWSLVHPDDRPRLEQSQQRHLATGTILEDEFRIIRPDGEVRHIFSRALVHRDDSGRPLRIVGLNRDITAERQRDQVMAAIHQRLQFVLNATGFGVWEYDYARNEMTWDNHMLEIYGLRRETLAGGVQDWHDRVHPEDLARVRAELDAILSSPKNQLVQQFRIVRPDGTVRHIEARSYVLRHRDGRPERMVGFDNDVTEAVRLREELRITAERWHLAVSSSNDGVWDWNIATDTVFRDARYAEMVGAAPEDLATDRHIWQALGHRDDVPAAEAALQAHLAGTSPVYQSEYRLRHRDGPWVWILDRGKVVDRDAGGRPLRMVGTHTDITHRKQLEERLRHGEEMSLQLSRLAQIGAWEWEIATSKLTWSPEMYRIHEVPLGYEPTLPKSLEFYPPQSQETFSEALNHSVRAGTGFDLELPFRNARGHQLYVRVLARAEVKEGRTVRIYGAFQDITARRDAEEMRRQLESQLFQAQKMETLGTLAGGIAHDFNNLLTGILGYQDLALDTLAEADPARSYLAAARDASLRARELVAQILTFRRQAGSEKVPVNLAQVVEDARRFLRATVPATIRIDVEIAPDCGRVLADATQIHQVLLNLGSNAAHAMRTTGGSMRLALAPAEIDETQSSSLNHLAPGRYLKLEFSDTGHGMDEETRKRIFDPFFTTKEVGQGTGLGLSVVHGIIQAHRGTITVQSSPGHGATFTLYLPVAEDGAEETLAAEVSFPRGHGELIAVVDDEDIVRTFAQMALEKTGYRVASYDSPAHCLEDMRKRPGDFALLLTDQTMPVMKGIELAAEVRTFAPNLPVLIMSGYFSRISPDKLAQIGHVALLSKPFTNEELARLIHRSIQPEPAGSRPPFAG